VPAAFSPPHGNGAVALGQLRSSGAGAETDRGITVAIAGDEFQINGNDLPRPHWRGRKIQGLLLNSRMVQGIFDDRNPLTAGQWKYSDTGKWDPERNTREFIAAMPVWRRHGLLAFTIIFRRFAAGVLERQPWHNSAIEADGSLRSDYLGGWSGSSTRPTN